jgi:hypothetical protein
MRVFFAVLSLLLYCAAHSQDVQSTLDKYSYLVQTSRQEAAPQALGFFVRYETRLFLITSACFLKNNKQVSPATSAGYPDTVFVQSSTDTSIAHLALPVVRLKKATKEPETSDICVVEIKNSKRYNVFSVEDFFVEEVPCDLAKSVVVAGYAKLEASDDQNSRGQTFLFNSSLEEAYCLLAYIPEQKAYDRLHYFPSFANEAARPALSGAPAYLLTKDDTIVFGGVYVGMSTGTARGKIIRPEHVIYQVIDRINQK